MVDNFHDYRIIELKTVKGGVNVPRYAIAYDLNTKKMKEEGLTESEKTSIYQQEIPNALSLCGFLEHGQGSLYYTKDEENPLNALIKLESILKEKAPNFCKYASRIHVFRMEEWSDATELITGHKSEPLMDKVINM